MFFAQNHNTLMAPRYFKKRLRIFENRTRKNWLEKKSLLKRSCTCLRLFNIRFWDLCSPSKPGGVLLFSMRVECTGGEN